MNNKFLEEWVLNDSWINLKNQFLRDGLNSFPKKHLNIQFNILIAIISNNEDYEKFKLYNSFINKSNIIIIKRSIFSKKNSRIYNFLKEKKYHKIEYYPLTRILNKDKNQYLLSGYNIYINDFYLIKRRIIMSKKIKVDNVYC
jgi:hypothetical protein